MKIAHVAEDKNPVVLGRLGREPGLPTIAFYGHYDVQVCARSGVGCQRRCVLYAVLQFVDIP